MDGSLLDDIINRLLEVRGRPGKQVQLAESEVIQLCVFSKEIFLAQPNLLELEAPIKICGDIHGQYSDLLRLFEYGGLPPKANYLFLGDYVDRGKQSLETICLLLAYKVKYPENFFLLRGNHECASINRIYGFYDECKRRFNVKLWKIFTDCFNCLPVAALIDEKILCMHGGLSPDLHNLDQIRNLQRPTDVPESGLLCDLLWSDPCKDVKGWGMNDRGVSYTFGADRVTDFLQKHDLDLICRAHQVVEDGSQSSTLEVRQSLSLETHQDSMSLAALVPLNREVLHRASSFIQVYSEFNDACKCNTYVTKIWSHSLEEKRCKNVVYFKLLWSSPVICSPVWLEGRTVEAFLEIYCHDGEIKGDNCKPFIRLRDLENFCALKRW
ncbi:hypothetical protein Vadar_013510 [Vaccinium darrowii]|uniref:Uncharacterized protein n=1 Tax=Vaccinium darrowii TaxID=229202 RepID=A0ACB7XH68_9ERIC|nr:hypothetical protein Vadar_013510 [Vaccinium darrowii]